MLPDFECRVCCDSGWVNTGSCWPRFEPCHMGCLPKLRIKNRELMDDFENSLVEKGVKIPGHISEKTDTLNEHRSLPSGSDSVSSLQDVGKDFSVVLCDPPWSFRDKLDKTRTLSRFYETMLLDEIKSLAVNDITSKNSVLFLWTPNATLPEALELMKHWGFIYKGNSVWNKMRMGMGHIFRNSHELLLVGIKGHPKVKFKGQMSVVTAPVQIHSQKPEEYYDIIERLYDGPYLEMFARNKRANWSSWGNQVN